METESKPTELVAHEIAYEIAMCISQDEEETDKWCSLFEKKIIRYLTPQPSGGAGEGAASSRYLDIELPAGFMNVGISADALIADTNDSAKWDTLRFPLPEGKWSKYSQDGKKVRLVSKEPTND